MDNEVLIRVARLIWFLLLMQLSDIERIDIANANGITNNRLENRQNSKTERIVTHETGI